VQTAVAGSEPVVMLSGPPEAARICLAKAGMSVSDIDVWEVNEAFAAVLAHTIVALDLDESRVNVNGGALAPRPSDRCYRTDVDSDRSRRTRA
jgi:acetyl-CoA C-acetyltransferase